MHAISCYDEKVLETMSQRAIGISSMYNEDTFAEAIQSIAVLTVSITTFSLVHSGKVFKDF